jgi:hypothetical protein
MELVTTQLPRLMASSSETDIPSDSEGSTNIIALL